MIFSPPPWTRRRPCPSLTVERRPAAVASATAFAILLGLAPAAFAENAVWQWVDANGVTNYTQQKPKGVPAVLIAGKEKRSRASAAAREAAPAPVPEIAATNDDEDLSAEQQSMLEDLQAAERARQDEIAKIRQANCEKARSVLARLSARDRIRVRNPDGTERVIGEDERQQRIQTAQDGIVNNCETNT